jgi:hypothetical protein
MSLTGECPCLDEQCSKDAFEITDLTVYRMEGMVNTLDVCECKECGSFWLWYSIEDENRAGWGKWFRGLIPPGANEGISPDEAFAILEDLPWHFYGGSYYRTAGERSHGPVRVSSCEPLAKAA